MNKQDPFFGKSPRNILKKTLKNKINEQRSVNSGIFERSVQPLNSSPKQNKKNKYSIFERSVQPITPKKRKTRKHGKSRKSRK